jgi:hypothetical protein
VFETLEEISSSQNFNPESSSGARCFMHSMAQFEFIVTLCTVKNLMAHFKNVTVALQGVEVDVIQGFKMIQTISTTLQTVSY